MDIVVLGAGAWGTALADIFAENGMNTTLWARSESVVRSIAETGATPRLQGVGLCPALKVSADIQSALVGAKVIVIAIPSQAIRVSLQAFAPWLPDDPIVVCASKGIELNSLAPMSQVVAEALDGKHPRYAILSGPSFAAEVGRRLPTTVSLGCADHELGHELQEVLSTPRFRVYFTPDYRGVELGGAVKNVIAIAAGLSDGLQFGHDARAAIITRGLAEMSRLGRALGGQERTFMGLSGMGDLVLTCTGDLSRNRQVGLSLGQGKTLEQTVDSMNAVAEGVKTTESLYKLSQKLRVELPITEQVYSILYQGKDPERAVRDLMDRDLKDE